MFLTLGWVYKVKVAQLCLTLCDPLDYTVHVILQARILEWVSFPFSNPGIEPRSRTLQADGFIKLNVITMTNQTPKDTYYLTSLLITIVAIVIVQSLSRVHLLVTPWIAVHQASLSFTISQRLFRIRSIESLMPSNHLILCNPLLLLPSIFPSIRVF